MADAFVECIVPEQSRRRKGVKSLWVRPVAEGVLLVLLAYCVRGVDAQLTETAALNERIGALAQENAILSQEMAEVKNIARALRREVDLLTKKYPDESVKTHVDVAALQKEIDQLRAIVQDYKSDIEEKQSKKFFLLERLWLEQKMDDIKQSDEEMRHEIELLKNKTACNQTAERDELTTRNDSIVYDVVELKRKQDLVQQELKHYEDVLKNELETLKQQLKQKQDEAASKSRFKAIRQDLHRDLNKQREAQGSLSAESVWRLVVVLWVIFYLFIYHQKFCNNFHELKEDQKTDSLRAEVAQVKEDQTTDRAVMAQVKEDQKTDRAEVDKLKEDQKTDRMLLGQITDAQRQTGLKTEVSQLAINTQKQFTQVGQELKALKKREEEISKILNERCLLPLSKTD